MVIKFFVLAFILLAITKPIFAEDDFEKWLTQEKTANRVLLSKSSWSESRERYDYIQILKKSGNLQVMNELAHQYTIIQTSCAATTAVAGVSFFLNIIPVVARSTSCISDYFEPSHITPAMPNIRDRPGWFGHDMEVWVASEDRAYGTWLGDLGLVVGGAFGSNDMIKGSVDSTTTMLKAIYSKKSWSTCNIARRKFAEAALRLANIKKIESSITNPAAVMDDSRSNFKPTDTQPESAKKTAEGVER